MKKCSCRREPFPKEADRGAFEGMGLALFRISRGDEMANWIKGAVKNKGALHRHLHIPEGQKITVSRLKDAIKRDGKVTKEAKLASTL